MTSITQFNAIVPRFEMQFIKYGGFQYQLFSQLSRRAVAIYKCCNRRRSDFNIKLLTIKKNKNWDKTFLKSILRLKKAKKNLKAELKIDDVLTST